MILEGFWRRPVWFVRGARVSVWESRVSTEFLLYCLSPLFRSSSHFPLSVAYVANIIFLRLFAFHAIDYITFLYFLRITENFSEEFFFHKMHHSLF